ncbi:hypothetical protein [Nesterenkonia aerolata]|uniref:Thiazolylpeptide-type bacteriocin n=1 Tax=Nesterenkonia aerolata TaxID=3074079 RepID=A0ABU2DSA7_9MICC|nr:hypothetical protein [Nesterenkonia sp. LY-0111]MDR8019387.1 hypothetical protein [Nesterenkonia sp. LY-0111]
MSIRHADFVSLIEDTTVTSFGRSTTLFEPTAARCSSSSSTCCTGCVDLGL